MVLIANSDGLQSQNVQNVSGETDKIVSMINQQYDDHARFGRNIIPYQDSYTVFIELHTMSPCNKHGNETQLPCGLEEKWWK